MNLNRKLFVSSALLTVLGAACSSDVPSENGGPRAARIASSTVIHSRA
jgi:hypothetical protein